MNLLKAFKNYRDYRLRKFCIKYAAKSQNSFDPVISAKEIYAFIKSK